MCPTAKIMARVEVCKFQFVCDGKVVEKMPMKAVVEFIMA